MDMNAPQQAAVDHQDGALLVFAGAGSGKTRVITRRVATLISRGVEPDRILAVTFTNKAAKEMQDRIIPLVGKNAARRVWAHTFHALGARLLRIHCASIDRTKEFVIYDQNDKNAIVKRCVEDLGLDKKTYAPSVLSERIEEAKSKGFEPHMLPQTDPEMAAFARVWESYEQWLRSCNAVDFEDLLRYPAKLAVGNDEVGHTLRSMFDHILVDEFQDTNRTQFDFVKAMSERTGNLCVVGDDDQAIYTWRGALVEYIREFPTKHFPTATVVKLEQNYRSTKAIVGCAMGVISQGKGRAEKRLWTDNEQGKPVHIVTAATDRDEARFVAQGVRRLSSKGVPLNQVSVLYRQHSQSRATEEALRDAGIRYRIVGGSKFFDRAEVKDMLSYMRLIGCSSSDVDLLRVINTPARGLGDGALTKLRDIAAAQKVDLWSALRLAALDDSVPHAARARFMSFMTMIQQFRATAAWSSPSDLAARVVETTGIKRPYLQRARELADAGKPTDSATELRRTENIDEFVRGVQSYEQKCSEEDQKATLRGYLERVALLTEYDQSESKDEVTLMTVHASKGLEFDNVFLIGFEEKRFPADTQDAMQLEEERRLAYVAITRAKKRLWVSHAETRWVNGKTESNGPSRYLHDFPVQHVEPYESDEYAWSAHV